MGTSRNEQDGRDVSHFQDVITAPLQSPAWTVRWADVAVYCFCLKREIF